MKTTNNIFDFVPAKISSTIQTRFSSYGGKDAAFVELNRDDVKRPYIFIGAGTCGLGAGADKTLAKVKAYCESKKWDAVVLSVGCIGLCSEEPLMDVQLPGKRRISFGQVTENRVDQLLDSAISGNVNPKDAVFQFDGPTTAWSGVTLMSEHPFFRKQLRVVLSNCGKINPVSIDEYVARGGYTALAKVLSKMTPTELCDSIEKSGLRGRGGGGFPTGKKWKIALSQESDQKYFVCNADEGDPGAFMDRAVIEGDPHRLVEGLAIAAYGIGATKAYVYIRAEYPLAIKHLKQAIADAKSWGFIGQNVFDSGFAIDIRIKMGAGAFVCGEETALIHSIEGKRGMPRPRPPFPAVQGLFGKPTVINNVETLANLPEIITHGHEWFASMGTKGSKGTKVFALSGKVKRTGLVEVPMGVPLRDIVFEIGGGILNDQKFKSVQIGGPSGGCIPDQNLGVEVDYESLKTVDAMMGSGGLVVMDEHTCMVDIARYFMDFIQRESCGKCIPCREGTKRMLDILDMITKGRNSESGFEALDRFKGVVQMEELGRVIRETSLCGLGQTAPNPVLSTLKYFRNEYIAHIFERKCPAKACVDMIYYTVDAEKCKGCTICAKKCPNSAIMGAVKTPHYIIPDKCVKCGICMTVCKFGAIAKETGEPVVEPKVAEAEV